MFRRPRRRCRSRPPGSRVDPDFRTMTLSDVLLIALIVAVDCYGWCVAWRLFRRNNSKRPSVLGDVTKIVVLGGVLGAIATAAAWIVLRSKFAILRLWFHVLVFVVAPVVLVRGVALWRASRRGFATLFGAVALAMLGTAYWATAVEPYRLEVTHHVVTSPRLAGLEQPVRVVVLADLQTDHIGEFEREVFRAIDAERPDLIVLPGDYLQVRYARGVRT